MSAALWGQARPGSAVVTGERAAGTFALGERSFQAVLRVARLPGDAEETVASIEVQDSDGALHFQRTLPLRVEGARFAETVGVDAALLQGRQGSGVLLTYSVLPSTPLGGRSWQVLGLVQGRMKPFSKPVTLEGELVEAASAQQVRAGWDSLIETDILNFRVWTGRFFVVVPLAVKWEWGSVNSACVLSRCSWRVEAQRQAAPSPAAVKLYPQPDGSAGEPEAVAVTPASKVEFLGAEGGVVWDETEEQVWFGVSEIVWLRVRIDGKEGWLSDPEDLNAIGLPEAG